MQGRLLSSNYTRIPNLVNLDRISYQIWTGWFFDSLDIYSDSTQFFKVLLQNKQYMVGY